MASGWTFKAAVSNSDLLSDALVSDALFRTDSRDSRFLFGFSNDTDSVLRLDKYGLDITGTVNGDGYACGSNILTTFSNLIDATKLDGEVLTRNLPTKGVTSEKIADSNVLTRHIAFSSIVSDHIADSISVEHGGTGRSNVEPGYLIFGSELDSMPLATSGALTFDAFTDTLGASNVNVDGVLSVGAISNIEERFQILDSNIISILDTGIEGLSNDVFSGDAIGSSNIESRHIGSNAILNAHIADGAVTPDKLSGIVPVEHGGTGRDDVDPGRILFGSDFAGDPLSADPAFAYDVHTSNLQVPNIFSDSRIHAGSNVIIGTASDVRYRFFIADDKHLAISQIDSNDVETGYLNMGDLVYLLSNVNMYKGTI